MSESDITKKEQPNPDEVLAAITSFNDVSIITNIFKELGWSYSLEIKETLTLAKQNANLSIKFKAIRHLRELLREAAEASGYSAKVSQTVPNIQGGTTTFSAKRISGILNPVKKIESNVKETQDDQKENRTEPDRGSDRGQSQTQNIERDTKRVSRPKADSSEPDRTGQSQQINDGINSGVIAPDSAEPIRDSRRAFPERDVESGGTEPPDGEETSRPVPRGENSSSNREGMPTKDSGTDNPCIQTRPPTCDQDLFPGISSAED